MPRSEDIGWKADATADAAGAAMFRIRCGWGGDSLYIDSVMLRERDNSADSGGSTTIGPTLGWRSESDGTLAERPTSMGKHCQNWRADVVAIVTSGGIPVEYTRYSAYGEPTVYPAADIDMDGDVDSADESEYYNVKAGGTNGPSAYTDDINFDGYQDNEDEDLLDLSLDWNLGLSGKGRVSSPQVGNRIGYAGYQWDQVIRGNHVRHRVCLPEIGRWTRRDPLGYVDSTNQYEYATTAPVTFIDPFGQMVIPWPGFGIGAGAGIGIGTRIGGAVDLLPLYPNGQGIMPGMVPFPPAHPKAPPIPPGAIPAGPDVAPIPGQDWVIPESAPEVLPDSYEPGSDPKNPCGHLVKNYRMIEAALKELNRSTSGTHLNCAQAIRRHQVVAELLRQRLTADRCHKDHKIDDRQHERAIKEARQAVKNAWDLMRRTCKKEWEKYNKEVKKYQRDFDNWVEKYNGCYGINIV